MTQADRLARGDAAGNAVSMTTTVEDAFGARLLVEGFFLNNELTDFSFRPEVDGRPVANRIGPAKRPRSSMSPTIVFGPDDQLQHRYLAGLGVTGGFAYHLCPSSEGFVRLTEGGLGWGLVPELEVRDELASGRLVELVPERFIDVPLYWHHWRNGGELLAGLTEHLRRAAGGALVQAP